MFIFGGYRTVNSSYDRVSILHYIIYLGKTTFTLSTLQSFFRQVLRNP